MKEGGVFNVIVTIALCVHIPFPIMGGSFHRYALDVTLKVLILDPMIQPQQSFPKHVSLQ